MVVSANPLMTHSQILNTEKTEAEAAYRALVALGDIVCFSQSIHTASS